MKSLLVFGDKKIIEVGKDSGLSTFLTEDGVKHYFRDNKNGVYSKCECGHSYQIRASSKLSEFRDRTYFCKSCSKKGSRNAFFGKKHDQKFKDRLSQERKGKWYLGEIAPMYGKSIYDVWVAKYGIDKANELQIQYSKKHSNNNSGVNNPFYGRTHSNESIHKMVSGTKKYRDSLTQEEKDSFAKKISICQKVAMESDPIYYKNCKSKAARASHASSLRYKKNKIEIKVENKLNEMFLYPKYSTILGFNQYDFGFKGYKILLEVQGDYWHGNPNLYTSLNSIQTTKQEKDKIKREFAIKNGFKIYYIWEESINKDDFSILYEISKEINREIDKIEYII